MVTKYRKKCLTKVRLDDFESQARARCAAWGGTLIEMNSEADHVHLLLGLPPTAALADFVNALKTGPSRRLRNAYADHLRRFYNKPVLWRRRYSKCSLRDRPKWMAPLARLGGAQEATT